MSAVILTIVLWMLLLPAHSQEADSKNKNPRLGDPVAIAGGRGLFRVYCSFCHGLKAEGGLTGPDLTRPDLTHSSTDQQMFGVISQGILGTDMPPYALPEDQIWQVMAFLAEVRSKRQAVGANGDWQVGETLYFGKGFCSNCHMVGGEGGRLGPDLTRIGAMRSLEDLQESIRDPSANFRTRTILDRPWTNYEPVTLVAADGSRITGVIRNEDTFTIQIMDQKEALHSRQKGELKEIVRLDHSLMPVYSGSMLSDADLRDLLTFLTQQPRGKKD